MLSFMMMRRIAWNCLELRGFVKKSAMLSRVRTKGTSISRDSTKHVAHEEVAASHMFHAIVVFRVVRHVARARAVRRKLRGARLCAADAG